MFNFRFLLILCFLASRAACNPLKCSDEKLSRLESDLVACRAAARDELVAGAGPEEICSYLDESVNVCGEIIRPCLAASDLR